MAQNLRTTISTNEARQGTTHHGVRYVLAASTVLGAVALLAAYFVS
jgi:sorbitol-specific phosphotransferase system component IIBC